MDSIQEKPKRNNFYPLQVWIMSVAIIAPILLFVWGTISDSNSIFDIDKVGLFFFIWAGLILSFPTLAICYTVFVILNYKSKSPFFIKVIFNLVCITGIVITFFLIGGWESFTIWFTCFYSVSVIISSIIFKILKKEDNKDHAV
jgi:hypothetical protein